MQAEIKAWMEERGYENLAQFQGKLSRYKLGNPELYERAQYVRAFVGAE